MRAAAKPSPNSTPRTAGTAKIAWLSTLSTASKNGSPQPAGTPETRISISAPIESQLLSAWSGWLLRYLCHRLLRES